MAANPNMIGGGRLTRAEVSGDKRRFEGKKIQVGQLLLRLWKYLGRNRVLLVLALVLSLSSSMLALYGPKLSGQAINAIDLGTGKVDFDTVFRCAALMAGFYVASSGLATLWDEEGNTLYASTVVKSSQVQKGRRVPTLMYHVVSNNTWGINELFVKPSEMERQLKYLNDNGYTTITFEDLSRLDEIKKPVLLTFDDGYRDNYEELFPLLKKYNAKATIFMITGKLSKNHYLTPEMITEMVESGLVSVQSHTVSHPKLGEQKDTKQRQEMEDSRLQLARLTKRVPFVLCYPSGSYNNATRSIGAEYYSFGIKMNGGLYKTGVNPFLIPRYYVSRATSLSSFASMVG